MKRTMSLMQEYRYILSSLLGLKKKVKELEEGGGTTEQENIIRIPSSTYYELGITPESTLEEKQQAIAWFLYGYDNNGKDVLFFEIKDDVIEYNFDVVGDWTANGITDIDSFDLFLQNHSFAGGVYNFKLEGSRLQAVLGDGPNLYLPNLGITEVNKITVQLESLALTGNSIVSFNPVELYDGIRHLNLDSNLMESFNPDLIPSYLFSINFSNNQISDWSLLESFANNLHQAPQFGYITTEDNITSPSGTNFKTILQSKGWSVL